MDQKTIQLLNHQKDFLNAKEKFVLLCTGIGGGKTFAGAHYVIGKCYNDGNGLGLISANTYKQLFDSTLSCLFRELDALGTRYEFNQVKGYLNIFGAKILCRSLENYDDLRGLNLSWAYVDELAYARQEAFEVLVGRLRDNKSKIEFRATSSPAGYNFMYDYWLGEKKTEEFKLIHASSRENIFLPDGYITSLESNYDKKMQDQEIDGIFTNIQTGRIYYGFQPNHIQPCEYKSGYPIWVGLDFNRDPFCGVIGHVYEDSVQIFDEIFIRTTNTHEVAQYIKERYKASEVNITPDSTGKALRTSSAGLSDHDILRNHGLKVMNVSNPFRVDRYNCLNNLFDKCKIIISPKCKHLINDLNQVCYKEGSSLPDISGKKFLTHSSDALGYLIFYLFGTQRKPVRMGYYA